MKEVKKRILSIASILLFLIVSTWFFYGPRKYLVYASMNLNKFYSSSELEIVNQKELVKNQKNIFIIKNKSKEEIHYQITMNNNYHKVRNMNCKIMSNNYVTYHIKSGNQYDIERVLSIDGIIYRGSLKPKEERKFELEWDSSNKTKKDEKYCFYPILHASKESI